MLNGDVLTDLDLTAQLRRARARRGRAPRSRCTRSRTRAPTGSSGWTRRRGDGVRREARAGPDRHQQHLRRRVRAGALGALRCLSAASGPRSSATSSRGWSATASTGTSATATGRTSGRPSATSRRPSTSSRARSRPRSASGMGGYVCVEDGVDNARADRARRARRERLPDRGGRAGRRAAVLEHGVIVGEGTTIEGAVVMRGHGDRRPLHAARLHRRRRRADRRPLRDRRDERGRGGRDAGRGQRGLQRRPAVPGRGAARRRAAVLMERLDRAAIAAVDSTGQLDEVLGLAEHLRDALWRVDSSGARPVDAPGGVIVAGMGGSAAGARLAVAALGARLTRPLMVSDGYALPGWAGPSTLVLCSSYSGATEETLAAYDDAAARGAPRLVATTGGPLAERARRDGVPVSRSRAASSRGRRSATRSCPRWRRWCSRARRRRCAARSRRRRRWPRRWRWSGARTRREDCEAKTLARSLHGTVPVIAGAELAAAAAYRWKCQFNENAALPAFASCCRRPTTTRSSAGRPRARWARSRTCRWRSGCASAQRAACRADGGSPRRGRRPCCASRARRDAVERLVSLVLLGDLVTIYAAVLRSAIRSTSRRRRSRPRSPPVGEFSVPEDGCWPATVLGHVLHRLRARFRGRGRAQRRLDHRWRGARRRSRRHA